MVEDKSKMGAVSDGSPLEGQWINVLQTASYGEDGHIKPKDLDDLVSEYQARGTNGKAPVVLGRAKADGAPIGTVDEIRREGDVLQAKVSKIDPRVDQLYSKGVFKKRSAMIERSPKGVALSAVGLVVPQWNSQRGREDDEMTPSLDELHAQTFGTQSVVFSDSRILLSNTGRLRVDPESARLSESAKRLASEKSITFAEALGQVAAIESSTTAQRSGRPQSVPGSLPADPNSARLSELAKQRAREKSITFSEALTQVVKEQPELTVDPFALPRKCQ